MTTKTTEYASYYRNFLKDLIENILKEVPNDPENSLFIMNLNNTLESLWYKAPEILNSTLISILDILKKYIPLNADDALNPQWVKNIRDIWTTAVRDLDNRLEIDAITKDVSGPP